MCIIHQDENILLNRIQKKCYSAKTECGFLFFHVNPFYILWRRFLTQNHLGWHENTT